MADPTHAEADARFYITTPIYYVNDRPHIGHVYTTLVADILARCHRLRGEEVFFLTGTDEHAAKVVDAAREHGLTPRQWADQNAEAFRRTFARLGVSNDDFIRTSESRHREKVRQYVQQLIGTGDVYEGQYEGWYDAGQEEYVPENKAREWDYQSPINGRPLVRRAETNYFFRLSAYADRLLEVLETRLPARPVDDPHASGPTDTSAVTDVPGPGAVDVQPEARRHEVLGRIREGLNDVPISRNTREGDGGEGQGWGIKIPGDESHTIYVWIDALFNYLSTIDTDERRHHWPADVHVIAKDILWFHAVIWPAVLMALDKPLPKLIYAHSFWISEGRKMSKSLGNFIDLERIDHYVQTFGLDALRYYLAAQGPMGATDADFADAHFKEIYNTDLANTLGNCASRVANMIGRYFDGKVPADAEPPRPWLSELDPGSHVSSDSPTPDGAWLERKASAMVSSFGSLNLSDVCQQAMGVVRAIDAYIEAHQPFKLAKDMDANREKVGTILYHCAEALRIASVLLWPVMPDKCEELWRRMGCSSCADALADRGRGDFDQWTRWGGLAPGTRIEKGEPLFPRYQEPRDKAGG